MKYAFPQLPCYRFLLILFCLTTFHYVYANNATDSVDLRRSSASISIIKALNHKTLVGNTFTEVASLTGVIYGDMEWGDYDNDNDLDVVVTGRISDPGSLEPAVGFTKLVATTYR